MTDLQFDIIKLVRSALTGVKFELSESFDIEAVFNIAKKHRVFALLYYGAINCGVDTNNAFMQQLFFITCKNIAYNEKQMYEIGKLAKAFDDNGISYMPLKGTLLKKLYPKPEMRAMGDADILVKTDEFPEIRPIMLELGYNEITESDHEYIWDKSGAHIELHKRLIPSYNKDYYNYYGNGWQLAKICEGTRYSMTAEDSLIYNFTHFAKHYREAGIGIRHFVDLWVFKNAHKKLDEEYIKDELKKLQLYDFYLNVSNTLSAWFDNEPFDEKSDFISQVIFDSGVYGRMEAYSLAQAVKTANSTANLENVKFKKFFKLVFSPYAQMRDIYPILEKAPILLPFAWIYRVFTALLFKKDKIKKHQENLSNMTAENITDFKNALNFVGLDFNFKE